MNERRLPCFKSHGTPPVFILLAATLLFSACKDSGEAKKIKLRAAVTSGTSEAGAVDANSAPLRISVAAMLSPEASFVMYKELAEYIGKRLDRPVKIIFKKTYAETNDSLKNSESDMAFICTGAYIAAKNVFPLDIIAVPVVNGKMTYNSVIVVPKNSPVHALSDLKGKTFAFTDEFSLTGNLYVKVKLSELGQNSSGFFGETFFTGSHDNSIKAVSQGFADAACVDSLIYEALLKAGDLYAKRLRIIEKSPPFGIPPLVARVGLSSGIKDKLRIILLGMHKNKEGTRILRALSVEWFAVPPPGLYSYAEKVLGKR